MTNEELFKRADDLAARAEKTGSVTHTAFLTPAEQYALRAFRPRGDCRMVFSGGVAGAETAVTLEDCCVKIREIIAAGREVTPDIMVICHGGPIADPEDAAYVIKNVPEIDGFFGASSIERLASERGMTAQAAAFKAISK